MASEIRVNSLTNRSGLSTVSITDTGAVIAGLITATTFSGPLTGAVTGNVTGNIVGNVTGNIVGNVTGNVTGNTSGTAGGLTGSPSITVADITATGNVSIGGTLTYEDVTNIDSVGIITAQSDVLVGRNLSVASGISTVKALDYTAIDTTISDTAVDVFIYDTSKDSDGGAWRKRTQNTSWYNETLNTATRGSRKEFPAVAVIVATIDDVIIYDGDDPDLPMWMIFESGSSGNAWENYYIGRGTGISFNPDITGVAMLNATLVVGKDGAGAGNFVESYTEIDFISDNALHRDAGSAQLMNNSIVSRNGDAGGYYNVTSTFGVIVQQDINDVAMTVLPNAPIDSATGLPIPTIAVATAGGVSVIKDDGTVVDLNIVNRPYSSVDFTSDNLIFAVENPSGVDYDLMRYFEILSADRDNSNAPNTYGPSSLPALFPTNTKGNIFDSFAYGSPVGLSIIDHADGTAAATNGMIAYVASEYNTGWMQGDIKGAFLSDTDTTNVTGSELITNGTFDSNTTGWTAGNSATLSIVSNVLRITYNGSANPYAVQEISGLTVGKIYVASVDIVNISAGEDARMIVGTTATASVPTSGNFTTTGAITVTFTAESTSHWVKLQSLSNAAGEYAEFDNISVKIAEEDRSVNNKGLQVFGTITKSAVATGAELVAYSGFSASNYLRQPYNSNLDFGSNDFSVVYWFNQTTHSDFQDVVNRSDSGQNNGSWLIQHINNGSIQLYVRTSGSYTAYLNSSSNLITNYGWTQIVVTRTSGAYVMYFNGRQVANGTGTTSLTVNSAELQISGRKSTNVYPILTGNSIALARVSASAPSAEQVKKMYEDEKCLFHENAKATLYGSSDAVTALAFDNDTNLLHVGTSSGRSDFQGLSRINNNTTAVTTAITAQNEFIIEQ